MQDCLERAIGRWHQRRQDGDARSWLFAILHNLAINRLRQAQRRGRHIAVEEADESVFARQPTQEQGLRLDGLRAALAELPEEQRAVILLVSVEDLTYAEAARVLGVPIGTVMSRLARGREKLRRALEEEPAARETKLRRVK